MIEIANARETVVDTEKLVQTCCRALDDKKAEEITILHLGSKSSVADYFVIATGTSSPHLRALRVALEKELDSQGAPILGMDMTSDSGWVVVDADNILFHLFTKPMREKYALEKLWKDADLVGMEKVG
jgi:ribosome-associated protein